MYDCLGRGSRDTDRDEGTEMAENVDAGESEGMSAAAEVGVCTWQTWPFLGRPQRPQL